ncbi:MAG: hypothetical protein E7157_05990 [Lactobacillales bacterium]|nr:hypothetical protein [Lactobacillales bacterium]
MVFDNTGKIIIVRNIVFKDFYEGQINYNYDKHFVRPCLVISELEDKRYVLPITSTGRNEKFLYKKFKIYRDNLINQSLSTKINYIKLDQIIPIEPYYKEPVDELDTKTYYNCLLKLKNYYERASFISEEYEEIKEDVNKQLKKMRKLSN